MKRPVQFVLTLILTTFISGPAFAAISFSDDFESYPIYEGGDPTDLGGGWTLFVNLRVGFPYCAFPLRGYGPLPFQVSKCSKIPAAMFWSLFSPIVLACFTAARGVFYAVV